MIGPTSTTYLFLPEQPLWLRQRCFRCYDTFTSEYSDLATRYIVDLPAMTYQPNIDLTTINNYANDNLQDVGTFSGPWISKTTNKGAIWLINTWEITDDPPTPEEYYDYWEAMVTGLMVWQMYSVFLSEQFVRFGEFGHYGRKPKENR